MDTVQRRRIQKHKEQMQRAAQRRKQQQKKKAVPTPGAVNIKRAEAQKKQKRDHEKRVPHKVEKPDVDPAQYNNECFIVGGGPSLSDFDWKLLNGKFVIAINRAYEVLPDAQILYFTDNDYWQKHKGRMMKHKGIKMRGRIKRKPDIKEVMEIQLHSKPAGWSDTFGEAYHGSNSGYACIQVAAQLGFTTIYLLGFDMKHQGKYIKSSKNSKGVTHWHDGHRRIDPPSAYTHMMRHYKTMVPEVKKRGLNVINVNNPKKTALTLFPVKTVDEVFNK